MTFAERDPLYGWGGIIFTSGTFATTSTLSGVTVTGVRTFLPTGVYPATEEPIGAAVTVANRSVVITGRSFILRGNTVNSGGQSVPAGTVWPTNGVQVAGRSGRLTVTGSSTVQNHGGIGVLATGGGFASITGRSNVFDNASGGVRATGYRSNIGVSGYAQVNNNSAAGVRADQQGTVSVRTPGGSLSNTSASDNLGGLYTGSGAGIDAQQCDGTGGPTRPNRFVGNTTRGGYDAEAFGGSLVSAPYAFWGPLSTPLVTRNDNSSTLALGSRVPDDATPQPGCPVYGPEGRAAGQTAQTRAELGEDAPRAARGAVTESVALLAAAARQAAWAGDMDAAFVQIAGARAATVTEDDREAVFEATAALLAVEQPPGVVAGLEVDAATLGTVQAWSQRTLAIAYAAGGRSAEADALALILAGRTDASHAAFGHGLRVRLAVDAGDGTGALDRLTAFANVATEDESEALGSSVALVAATFPDADLSGLPGLAGRGMAGRGAPAGNVTVVGRSATVATAANVLDVFPNPAVAGQATVRVTLAEASAHAMATVYDALGRRVAVLYEGALGSGPHAFPLGALPPGVYVVHVRMSDEVEGGWTDVRRITLTR